MNAFLCGLVIRPVTSASARRASCVAIMGGQGHMGQGDQSFGRQGGMGQQGRNWGQGSHRGKGPMGYTRSDERIRESVCEALQDDDNVDASQIDVTVRNGEVILSGTVDDRQSKRVAEDIVERLPGVKDVQNQIKVQDRQRGSQQSESQHTGSQQTGSQQTAGSQQTGSQPGNSQTAGKEKENEVSSDKRHRS